MEISFTSNVWEYPGQAAWHFVSVPPEYTESLKEISSGLRRGFGSIRVRATVGVTSWNTSIFPDTKSGCYLLPLKKSVRKSEQIVAKDTIRAIINIQVQ